jgi:hypothetical protein
MRFIINLLLAVVLLLSTGSALADDLMNIKDSSGISYMRIDSAGNLYLKRYLKQGVSIGSPDASHYYFGNASAVYFDLNMTATSPDYGILSLAQYIVPLCTSITANSTDLFSLTYPVTNPVVMAALRPTGSLEIKGRLYEGVPHDLWGKIINDDTIELHYVENIIDETGFRIQRSTDGTNFSNRTPDALANTTVIYDLYDNPSASYTYRVAAVMSGGTITDYTNIAYIFYPPRQLLATAIDGTTIQLAWQNTSSLSNLSILHSTDNINFSVLASNLSGTCYWHQNISSAGPHYYRVEYYGNPSNTSSATAGYIDGAQIAAPFSLVLARPSSSVVHLEWVDNSSNENGFIIERSRDGINFTAIATVHQDAFSYDDSVSSNFRYVYRVRAYSYGSSVNYSQYTNFAVDNESGESLVICN